MPVILWCLAFATVGGARVAANPILDNIDVMHDRALRAAAARTSLKFHLVRDVADPALAYDVLFMGEYRRELRRGFLFAGGDLLWARVKPDYDVTALDRVARLLARKGGRSVRLSLESLPAFDLYSELRRRARGQRVIVIDGLARLRTPDGEEDARLADQLEMFVGELVESGRMVILVDRDHFFDEAGDALRRLPTAFPDGSEALDLTTCNDRLWRQ